DRPDDPLAFAAHSSTVYVAASSSPAFGRDDLLTGGLHEMSHVLRVIAGYAGSDRPVQVDGSRTLFVGPDVPGVLTADHSHPGDLVHPDDLVNGRRSPGVRRLPSALGARVLITARGLPTAGTGDTLQAVPLLAWVDPVEATAPGVPLGATAGVPTPSLV